MIVIGAGIVLGWAADGVAEMQLLAEEFLKEEAAQVVQTEEVTLQAEVFPWGFEMTKEVLLRRSGSRCRTACKLPTEERESEKLKGLDPYEFEWGFSLTTTNHPHVSYGGRPMTFGGMSFNR